MLYLPGEGGGGGQGEREIWGPSQGNNNKVNGILYLSSRCFPLTALCKLSVYPATSHYMPLFPGIALCVSLIHLHLPWLY